jgi:hypothetical protein
MKSRTIERSMLGLVLAVAVLFAGPALALEKVGTTSMQVLKIPMGVRGIAFGNAMCASTNDLEAVWWNPGALTEMKGYQALFSRINMPAGIHLMSGAVGMPIGSYQAVTLHAISLYTDDMPVRTWDRPRGTGENFMAYDFVLGASYARKLTDKFSLGGNVRYLRSGLDDVSYDGVSVDLGTLYKTALRSMRLGMVIQNLGPNVRYKGEFLDYRNQSANENQLLSSPYEGAGLPTMFRLGIGFNFFEMSGLAKPKDVDAQMAVEMNHPNDNKERLNVGGECSYQNMLFLRLGGKFAYDEESWSGGFGLRAPIFNQYRVRVDAAYSYFGRLTEAASDFEGQPLRFGIGFEW